ncbi:ribonuclease J [Sphingomonas mali]|uniref:ribonuclease J n=1 Tax=Sphingomonas mali TaxID=40682 RepID=UPI00082DEAA2|nr:ribonuclease J [Sphingomonas mali]
MTPGKELLFVALGGSGEIGMNVNLYGCQGKWLMVDMGVTFADPAYPGVEIILPDLQFIEEQRANLVGIVLTHGHEDHIGALPYLADDLRAPLFASKFTAGLIRGKLEEEGVQDRVELNVVEPNKVIELGPFKFRFVPLAHSIPEASALLIESPYGKVFHTGDWKLDSSDAVLGTPSTPEQLTAVGDEGVFALVCDSTNVFNPQASGSEASVRDGLIGAVKKAKGRVVVTTFASNAARLQTLGEVAKATKRKICVTGRSLDRILMVARANGYLKSFPDPISPEAAMSMPGRDVLVVATGGQGEPRAALGRIADGTHPIKLVAGDTVVFSSKQIPGNELAIGRIQNQLAAAGVEMVTERQEHVHVSGHPGRPELEAMYGWIRPQLLVPVHGEMRHMMEQARFGLSKGIPQALVQSDGDIVRLAPGKPEKLGHAPVGRLMLDGDVILPADGATMNERRRVATYGQMSVAVAIDGNNRLVGVPRVGLQGIPVEEDREAFIDEAIDAAAEVVKKHRGDLQVLRESLRLGVRRVATRWTGKKPVVDVLVIEA